MSLMFQAVVIATEELEVGELGLPSLLPGEDVVDIAPAGRPVATGVTAMAVSHHHRPPEGGRDHPGLSPHIEGFGSRSHDHPGEGGITGQGFEVCLGKGPSIDRLPSSLHLSFETIGGDQNDQMRSLPTGFGHPSRVHRLRTEVD
jgi:hypothetical protein